MRSMALSGRRRWETYLGRGWMGWALRCAQCCWSAARCSDRACGGFCHQCVPAVALLLSACRRTASRHERAVGASFLACCRSDHNPPACAPKCRATGAHCPTMEPGFKHSTAPSRGMTHLWRVQRGQQQPQRRPVRRLCSRDLALIRRHAIRGQRQTGLVHACHPVQAPCASGRQRHIRTRGFEACADQRTTGFTPGVLAQGPGQTQTISPLGTAHSCGQGLWCVGNAVVSLIARSQAQQAG